MQNRDHAFRSLIVAVIGSVLFLCVVPVIVSSTFLPAWAIAALVVAGFVGALWLIIKNIF